MIVTFYSFKGGVGSSMALVNVGEVLADWGYRVVLCDWDLEAPGLERYLIDMEKDSDGYRQQVNEFLARGGLMDMLREYKEILTRPAAESRDQIIENVTQGAPDVTPQHQAMGKLLLRRPFSYTYPLPSITTRRGAGWMRLLTVGRRDGDANQQRYAEMVRTFDWSEFYDKWAGDRYMDFFREDLQGSSDIVLLDSRTGVTEQGGVCTHHLADLVVLFSAANQMNFEGTKWMARLLSDPRLEKLRGARSLKVLPVASRIEWGAQKEELVDFENQFQSEFSRYVPDVVGDAETFLKSSEIPYIPFYSFKERVVAREIEGQREPRLYKAYQTLADAIARYGVSSEKLVQLRFESGLTLSTAGPVSLPLQSFKGPVFVSCGSEDMPTASVITSLLRSAGVRVVGSVSSLAPDSTEDMRGPQAIANAAGCVVALGSSQLDLGQRAELSYILKRQALQPGLRVVPAVLAAGASTDQATAPLTRFRALLVPENLNASSKAFLNTLLMELSAPPVGTFPKPESTNPFRGFQVFNETDARFFFGRDRAIEEVLHGLNEKSSRCRWIQVEGPSGCGKSSLARAGLVPAARAGWIRGVSRGSVVAVCQPALDPVAELAYALEPHLKLPSSDVISRLRSSSAGLRQLIPELAAEGKTLVLLVDSLEPTGLLAGGDPTRLASLRSFDSLLGEALADPAPSFFLITTIRSDLVTGLSDVPCLRAALNEQAFRYVVTPMSDDDLLEMLSGPSRMAGLTWETGLIGRVLDDAKGARETPGWVGQLLSQLWDVRHDNVLTHQAYEKLGGLRGVTTAWINRVVENLTEDDVRLARSLLLRLESGGGVRLTVGLGEALDAVGGGPRGTELLSALSRAGLITIKDESVQISHDAMLSSGSILRTWSDAKREELRRRDELEHAVAVWEAAGRSDGGLPVGPQLAYFKQAVGVSKRATQLLAEAAKHETIQRRQRRLFRLSSSLAILLLVQLVAVGWFVGQRSEHRTEAGALAVAAYNAADTQPLLALVLAIKAGQVDQGEVAKLALWRAIQSSYLEADFEVQGKPVSAAFSPDGKRLLAATANGAVSVWEITTGRTIVRSSLYGKGGDAKQQSREGVSGPTSSLTNAEFSPDGAQISVSSTDHTAHIIDALSGHEVVALRGHSDVVTDASFSPDGRRVVTASTDGTARIWDVLSGREFVILSANTAPVWGASFSPNGTRILTYGGDQSARIWDASSGKLLRSLLNPAPVALAMFSPDGSQVLTLSGASVRIWDSEAGRIIRHFPHIGTCISAAFSHDSKFVIVGTQVGLARISELSSGATVLDLRGHMGPVLSVALSPDGRQAATAGADGTVRIWDVQQGDQPIILMPRHDAPVTRVAFSPDGNFIADSSDDGTARIWRTDLPPPRDNSIALAELLRLAESRLPVTLTPDERLTLLQSKGQSRGTGSKSSTF